MLIEKRQHIFFIIFLKSFVGRAKDVAALYYSRHWLHSKRTVSGSATQQWSFILFRICYDGSQLLSLQPTCYRGQNSPCIYSHRWDRVLLGSDREPDPYFYWVSSIQVCHAAFIFSPGTGTEFTLYLGLILSPGSRTTCGKRIQI